MNANEIIKKLDEMVSNKVNMLNAALDSGKPFEEQSEGWKRRFNELNGLVIFAKNIDKNWHIELDTDKSYNLKSIRIVNWH